MRRKFNGARLALKPQPPLPAKTPIHTAARQHGARHMLTEFLLQRRAPGHELEAKAC